MTTTVLTVNPGHTLRQAARLMSERNVGSAIVIDPEAGGPGILSERDLLHSVARGEDPDQERVIDHLTTDSVCASPDWSLEEAAAAMARGGFRHLIVVDGAQTVGIVSVRDIVHQWMEAGLVPSASPPAAAPG